MQPEAGKTVEGKVTGITSFGAFIQLENNKTGLVHISEVSLSYVKDITDHLKEGDVVKAKVLSVDENGKISLSIKKALEEEKKQNAQNNNNSNNYNRVPAQVSFEKKSENLSFEDKMKQFMQNSDEKLQDIKRNMDSKRGGGRR